MNCLTGVAVSDEATQPNEPMRSPLRPQRPEPEPDKTTQPNVPAEEAEPRWASEPNSPSEKLADIRRKMERTANEFADRSLNRAQFNAIYSHYDEQRRIIEQIVARNPQNDAWKQVGRSGKTSFLRDHFQAQPVNYVVYLHRQPRALMGNGTRPNMERIGSLLRRLWKQDPAKMGVATVQLKPADTWLVMASGRYGVTFVTFNLEPSGAQIERVQNLNGDFERANRIFLERNRIQRAQMVFPQRSLLENTT